MLVGLAHFPVVCVFTMFGLVLEQTLVQVRAKLRTEQSHHVVPAHLAQGRAVHGAVGQVQGAGVEVCALDVIADPL